MSAVRKALLAAWVERYGKEECQRQGCPSVGIDDQGELYWRQEPHIHRAICLTGATEDEAAARAAGVEPMTKREVDRAFDLARAQTGADILADIEECIRRAMEPQPHPCWIGDRFTHLASPADVAAGHGQCVACGADFDTRPGPLAA